MSLPSEILPALITQRPKKLAGGSALRGVDKQIHVGELPEGEVAIDVTGKDRAFERQERELRVCTQPHEPDELSGESPVSRDPAIELLLNGGAGRWRDRRAGILGGDQRVIEKRQDLMPCCGANQVRPVHGVLQERLDGRDIGLTKAFPDTLEQQIVLDRVRAFGGRLRHVVERRQKRKVSWIKGPLAYPTRPGGGR